MYFDDEKFKFPEGNVTPGASKVIQKYQKRKIAITITKKNYLIVQMKRSSDTKPA